MKSRSSRQTKTDTTIQYGFLYIEDAKQCAIDDSVFVDMIEDDTIKSIRVMSLATNYTTTDWVDWDSKVTDDLDMGMTLRKEKRGKKSDKTESKKSYWSAYVKTAGVLRKKYIGASDNVTAFTLLNVALAFAGRKPITKEVYFSMGSTRY